ncbi:MAG: nitrile hydratase subunit alpha [Cyanobium sp.]
MSKENPEVPSPGRRDLLKTLGLAAAAAGGTALPATARPKEPQPPGHTGPSENAGTDLEYLGGSPVREGHYTNGEKTLPTVKERVLALKSLLIEKGIIPAQMLEQFVQYYEKGVGPHLGAAAVAHAWKNQEFRQALLNPPPDAPFTTSLVLQSFFFKTINPATGKPFLTKDLVFPGTAIGPEGNYVKVIQNGIQEKGPSKGRFVHNLVSCTVCSCYPQALLGIQPTWYKSQQYRARVTSDPMGVVDEFMEELTQNDSAKRDHWNAYRARVEEVQVWDSNSEVRFFVIPEMPRQWAKLPEGELRSKVTRNAMIGAEILLP